MPTIRHFLSITDITADETRRLIERAIEMKAAPAGSVQPLAGKRIALLFEKPSLRTRVSFQMGISELGGFSMYLGQDEVGLGRREPVSCPMPPGCSAATWIASSPASIPMIRWLALPGMATCR